ncbi:hypothetical protein GCM10011611_03100 [Aliidongia dinghuensis]|uniref:Uncharacterized protein n=1 Tax=Aliidongia dinghuensis TaxID=1867774 RepID=A0A8J2YP50_9PROT|nr:hypothetical protein [Aliidongia dinghuensis]GGF00897.1 hypothetical protein GCM10011611_03100 [Aliidongia dinghuensis]
MVFLALTRLGFEEFEALRKAGAKLALWVNTGVLIADELARLRAGGLSVTDFVRPIDPADHAAVAAAVDTIREHHPGKRVWVES